MAGLRSKAWEKSRPLGTSILTYPQAAIAYIRAVNALLGNTRNLVAVVHGPIHQNVVLAQLTAVASQQHPPRDTKQQQYGKARKLLSSSLLFVAVLHEHPCPYWTLRSSPCACPVPQTSGARSIHHLCVRTRNLIRRVCTRGNVSSPALQPMRVCARVSVLYKDCTQLFSRLSRPKKGSERAGETGPQQHGTCRTSSTNPGLSLLVGHEVENALLPQQYLVDKGADHYPHDGANVNAKRGGDDRPRGLQNRLRGPRHQVLGSAVKVQLEQEGRKAP